SIDEAANLYSKHLFHNRIVRGRMAIPVPNQGHDITPEQEFWGHCSNIQAWVEHDYDTRILMSNISFPLLRELVKAGDPKAIKVFKEEIALRLESGYPSVVQYLLNQGYIRYFTPSEFKTVIESTELIKGLSSDRKVLSRFLISCVNKFPTVVEEILLQVLKLPEGKKLIISSMGISGDPRMPYLRPSFSSNPQYLLTLKTGLVNLLKDADDRLGEDILECIQAVENNLLGQVINSPNISERSRFEALRDMIFDKGVLENLGPEKKLQLARKILGAVKSIQSKCPYCGKVIPEGQDTCDWCGHKKDDRGDFFPFPYIFKPPGGGGSMKGTIAVAVKVKSQT
ncbi:MAG: zinc ribbon domain-containing protein, partial [Candidatus Hodarchaeota archaeon]